MSKKSTKELLDRMANALERMAPAASSTVDFDSADAFVWHGKQLRLDKVAKVSRVDYQPAQGHRPDTRHPGREYRRFAAGLPANNALLWGARGMGKSSLVKAAHKALNPGNLRLVEIHREDIETLPDLLALLRNADRYRFIIFCDDLSFDATDTSYKSLKAALDGGLEGRPENVILYATSNRRHLLPRDMIENEQSTAISPSEAVQEKVSLSDRFGLWLGFHNCSQEDYLAMVDGYAAHFDIPLERDKLHAAAIEWSVTRGARSGRVAWQFIQNIAGEQGVRLQP